MRIVFVGWSFAPVGGIERYSIDLARALVAGGHDVRCVSTHGCRRDCPDELDVVALQAAFRPLRLFQRRYWHRLLPATLRRLANDADLLLCAHIGLASHVAGIAHETGVPMGVCTYGIEAWGHWEPANAAALAKADFLLACSTFTAHKVAARVSCPVKVLWPCVDIDRFQPDAKRKSAACPLILLTVGRLAAHEAYKGHDWVIRALPEISARLGGLGSVHYWIVGAGDDRARLQELAASTGVAGQTLFHGAVPDEKLARYYQQCDIFVMPSHVSERTPGDWTGEGFGIVYIEAGACGKPVIACTIGGQTDAVKDGQTGLLIPPAPDAVVEAVCALAMDSGKRSAMGTRAREFVVDTFSVAAFERRVADIFQELASNTRASSLSHNVESSS